MLNQKDSALVRADITAIILSLLSPTYDADYIASGTINLPTVLNGETVWVEVKVSVPKENDTADAMAKREDYLARMAAAKERAKARQEKAEKAKAEKEAKAQAKA